MKKSVFNLNENLVAALSYLLSGFSGIIVLILEKENKYVRFHAMQAFLMFLVAFAASALFWVLSFIPLISILAGMISYVFSIAYLAVTIYLIYMAYKGTTFKLPILGDVAYNQINK